MNMIRAAALVVALLFSPSFAPSAGATEGRQDVDGKRIAVLIANLDADDVSIRDDASRELKRIGEPALPALEAALKETTSEEVRGRIPAITKAIRRELLRTAFKGGKEVRGFSARASVEVRPDASIELTVAIMNVDTEPASLPAALNSDFSAPGGSASSSTSHGRFTIRQLSGERPKRCMGRRGCGSGPDRSAVLLAPGESKAATRVFNAAGTNDDYRLGPGDYEVDFTYYAKSRKLLDGAEEDLVSSTVKFTISG